MKRLTLSTTIVLSGLFALPVSLAILKPIKVFAADPVCYIEQKANYVQPGAAIVTTKPDCGGNPNFHEIEKNIRGHDLEADKCYIIQDGISGITNGDPIDSAVCKAAEAARTDNGAPVGVGYTPTTTTSADQQILKDTSQASSETINPDRAAIRNCDGSDAQKAADCLKANPIVVIIQDGLVFLSAVVGIVVIGSIIMGGIQYSASHGDPNAVAKAKTRITNALIAFVAYIFLYAFLQWLIPGGPF